MEPIPDVETQRYWSALRDEGQLLLCHCTACGHVLSYPRVLCPACHQDDLEWRPAAGRGTVYSYTVCHRDVAGFDLAPPYVVSLVELDEGVRVLTNVVDVDPSDVRIGQPVQLVLTDLPDGQITVARFAPAHAAHGTGS